MKLEDATILVVDDEPDLREIFSAWLDRKGCTVLTASNGVEALSILEARKIDVLLSDIRMPIMGGVALVRRIQELGLLVPCILFVSGYGDVKPREMYGLGVEALMEKPLSRKDLICTLEDSLRDRDQLWLTPAVASMEETVAITMASLEEAAATCQFQMGRGGCCFASGRPLAEGKTLDLSIHFSAERLDLKAQCVVRWFDGPAMQAGASFLYLDSACRDWVIAAMRNGAYRSFVPQCRLAWRDGQAATERRSLPELEPVP
jgi:CheY-like chemotaxis protein